MIELDITPEKVEPLERTVKRKRKRTMSLQDKHMEEFEALKRRHRQEIEDAKTKGKKTKMKKVTFSATDDDDEEDDSDSDEPRKSRKPPRSALFYDYDGHEEEEETKKTKKKAKKQLHKSDSEEKSEESEESEKLKKANKKKKKKNRHEPVVDDLSDSEKERRKNDLRHKKTKDAHDKLLGRVPSRKALGIADLMDKEAPKKPANSFLLFKNDIEPQLIAERVMDKSADVTQRSKIVSQHWRVAPQEMRDKYERRYRENLVAYEKAKKEFEAKVWVGAQMEHYIKEYQRGALREKELNEHCTDFFLQWEAMPQSEKNSLSLSRKRRVRKARKVLNNVVLGRRGLLSEQ